MTRFSKNYGILHTGNQRFEYPTCQVCGERYANYEVWFSVWDDAAYDDPDLAPAITHMCVPCLEVDLNRPITAQDFTRQALNAAYIRKCDKCQEYFLIKHPNTWYCSYKCAQASGFRVLKTCANDWCQARFFPQRKTQVYCSHDCNVAVHRVWHDMRPCKGCGERFAPDRKDQKFCSKECKQQYKAYEKVCLRCGNTFRTGRKSQKYCCYNPGLGSKICACGCGQEFRPQRSTQIYASRQCAMKARPKHTNLRVCACGCGQEFIPTRREQKFANRECFQKYQRDLATNTLGNSPEITELNAMVAQLKARIDELTRVKDSQ